MTKWSSTVTIDRPVEEVWKFVNDLSRAPEQDPGVIEAKQTSTGPPGVGATFQSKRRKEGLITFLCTEYEPNRKLTLEFTNTPLHGSTESLSLENQDGKARLTLSVEAKFNGFYRLVGPLLFRGGRKLSESQVSNIKRVMESEAKT